MKKTNKRAILSVVILLILLAIFMPLATNAQTVMSFNNDLKYGMKNSAEVGMLQLFLSNQGYFTGQATGNFLSATMSAVIRFQAANRVSPTGYFGPVTRSVANRIIALGTGTTATTPTTDATLTLTSPIGGSVETGQTQNVKWTSKSYTAPTVSVRLIRKVATNPARYEAVRTIASATKNDGSAIWVPAKSDVGTNMLVEVGCAPSSQGCRGAVNTASPIAVNSGTRYANTAAAFQAIEQSSNK